MNINNNSSFIFSNKRRLSTHCQNSATIPHDEVKGSLVLSHEFCDWFTSWPPSLARLRDNLVANLLDGGWRRVKNVTIQYNQKTFSKLNQLSLLDTDL